MDCSKLLRNMDSLQTSFNAKRHSGNSPLKLTKNLRTMRPSKTMNSDIDIAGDENLNKKSNSLA